MFQRHVGFDNYWEFEAFDAALTQQVAAGQVIHVVLPKPAGLPIRYYAEAYYQLPDSEQVGGLSTPNNAWRGYFLPLEEATAYQRKLQGHDRRARWGGLLLGLAAVTALIWWFVSLIASGFPAP